MISPRRFHQAVLLPNGKVLVVGGLQNTDRLSSAELYDPVTGKWTAAGTTRVYGDLFTAVTLLPNNTVLVAGGTTNSSPVADLFDPATGAWTPAQPPKAIHFYPTSTLLANGKVLLGTDGTPEIFDPTTGQWTITPNLNHGRDTQKAALLPDGRVLIAGGYTATGPNVTGLASAELYDAGLGSSNSWQSQIVSVTSPLGIGANLIVTGSGFRGISEGSGGNSQDSSTDYPLVQLRSIESGQTTFLLTTNWSANSFSSLPVCNFPPGYALVTVLVNGIQSTSSIVNISVPAPVITTLTNTRALTNGSFQFTFTNNPGALFGVLASTDLTLPTTNWTALSGVTESAPGQFQFNDPQATNSGQRFYQLFAP
jgi:hypothetical protein